jgi:adenine deaminase
MLKKKTKILKDQISSIRRIFKAQINKISKGNLFKIITSSSNSSKTTKTTKITRTIKTISNSNNKVSFSRITDNQIISNRIINKISSSNSKMEITETAIIRIILTETLINFKAIIITMLNNIPRSKL